jgi:hexosaminidase
LTSRRVGLTRYGVNDPAFNYTVPTNTWTHLVFVATATGTQLFVNGELVDSMAFNIPLPLGSLSRAGTGDRLRAALDDVAVFNRALTPPEIRALFAIPRP